MEPNTTTREVKDLERKRTVSTSHIIRDKEVCTSAGRILAASKTKDIRSHLWIYHKIKRYSISVVEDIPCTERKGVRSLLQLWQDIRNGTSCKVSKFLYIVTVKGISLVGVIVNTEYQIMSDSVTAIIDTTLILQLGNKVRRAVNNSAVLEFFGIQASHDCRTFGICSHLLHSAQEEPLVVSVGLLRTFVIYSREGKTTNLVAIVDIYRNNKIHRELTIYDAVLAGIDACTILERKSLIGTLIVVTDNRL